MNFGFSGHSVQINNNVLIVDGKRIDLNKETTDKEIYITFEGNVDKIEVDSCNSIQVKGVSGSIQTTNGDVHCENVGGSVSTVNGDVRAHEIKGSVSTVNGDVER